MQIKINHFSLNNINIIDACLNITRINFKLYSILLKTETRILNENFLYFNHGYRYQLGVGIYSFFFFNSFILIFFKYNEKISMFK